MQGLFALCELESDLRTEPYFRFFHKVGVPDQSRPRPFLTETVCLALPGDDDGRHFEGRLRRVCHFTGCVSLPSEASAHFRDEGWRVLPATAETLFYGSQPMSTESEAHLLWRQLAAS